MFTCKEQNKLTKLEIILLYSELIKDIGNTSFIIGDAPTLPAVNGGESSTPDNLPQQFVDTTTNGNLEKIERHLDTAWSMVLRTFREQIKVPVKPGSCFNDKQHAKDYAMHFNVPRDFSPTDATAIENLTHDFMVAYAIWRWCLLTYPAYAKNWEDVVTHLRAELKNLSISGTRIYHRPYYPQL